MEIKFKSIAARWFLNIFLVVALIVTVAAIALSLLFSSMVSERIVSLAGDYAYVFNSLSGTDRLNFKDTAIDIAGTFAFKDKIEVQVIDHNGEFVVSTTGFQFKYESMPDYEMSNKNGKEAFMESETSEGEPIMAGTGILYDTSGKKLGA